MTVILAWLRRLLAGPPVWLVPPSAGGQRWRFDPDLWRAGQHPWSEEFAISMSPDGAVRYVRSAGVYFTAVWARGCSLGELDLDPCSRWPDSAGLEGLPEGRFCRVQLVEGEHRPARRH